MLWASACAPSAESHCQWLSGQKPEATSKLCGNQVLSIEIQVDYSQKSITNSTDSSRYGPFFRKARTFIAEGPCQTHDGNCDAPLRVAGAISDSLPST